MARTGIPAYHEFMTRLLKWLKEESRSDPALSSLASRGRICSDPWVLAFRYHSARRHLRFRTERYYHDKGDRRVKLLSLEAGKRLLESHSITLAAWRKTFADLAGQPGERKGSYYVNVEWGQGQRQEDYERLSEPCLRDMLFKWCRDALQRFIGLVGSA